MSSGEVLQCDTPQTIYEGPTDIRVAKFVGEGTFFDAEASINNGETVLKLQDSDVELTTTQNEAGLRGKVSVGIRPHGFSLTTKASEKNAIKGKITLKTYYGSFVRYRVECGLGTDVIIEQSNLAAMNTINIGDEIYLKIAPEQIMLFSNEHSEEEL